MKNALKIIVLAISLLSISCKEEKKERTTIPKPEIKRNEPKEIAYTFQKSEEWLKNEGTNMPSFFI